MRAEQFQLSSLLKCQVSLHILFCGVLMLYSDVIFGFRQGATLKYRPLLTLRV